MRDLLDDRIFIYPLTEMKWSGGCVLVVFQFFSFEDALL